jgi:Asp/Glu/hydantoin racemase
MCRLVERERADVYIIACASDPGIDALCAITTRPVLGIFRSAVAMAVARAERFGVIGLVESSKARHRTALRAMGLGDRLAGEIAMNVSMDALLDPEAARSALIVASKGLAAMGAETIILGCTGMAHHRPAIRDAVNIPVIEPSQAATALAMGILLGEGPSEDR